MPTSVTLFRIATDCRGMLSHCSYGEKIPWAWGQVTGEAEKLDTPPRKTDIGPERGSPAIWDQEGAKGGGPGERPRSKP